MKTTVNPDLCIGCGLCAQMCDVVFEMDGDVARTKEGPVPSEAEAGCREAAAACPVEAIVIVK